MKDLIEKFITWQKITLNKIDKSELKFEVGSGKLSREKQEITIPVTLNFIIPLNDVKNIEAEIYKNLGSPIGYTVRLVFTYENVALETRDIVRLFVPHMIEILNGPYIAFTKQIDLSSFKMTSDEVTLKATGKTASELLNENVKPAFEKLFKETFNRELKFNFVNDEEKLGAAKKEFSESEKADIENCQNIYLEELKKQASNVKASSQIGEADKVNANGYKAGNTFRQRKKELPMSGNKIMGIGIQGEANTDLLHIDPSMGRVIVEAEIFKKNSRVIKSGNILVTISITDSKTTTLMKAFVSNEKWQEIDTNLNQGDNVKIMGDVEFDTYENMNTIMFKEIEKLEGRKGREDRCDLGKRVELHIHTKMSQMDGLNEAAEIVKQAAKWGQNAVAITDHGVVQSFPDAENTASDLRKKGVDIRVIFGLEGYIFDDEGLVGEDGKIDYRHAQTHHIIILAKTQEGLKNLYKLVSFSHLDYFYRKPRIPWSVLNKYREGLIIGSACSYGEVYDSLVKYVTYDKRLGREKVKEAKSEEEQLKIASRYDYLEIQPLINNRYMIEEEVYFEGKRVETEEDLKNINRKIIAIADKLGKKVVATTDSHYRNPEDAIYRNILMAGMGFEDAENGEGLYMRTTDEMMEEFSYLGDRAKEVVIDNTNYIASLCSKDILPVPKEKYPPKIEGSKETLHQTCMENAHKLYGDPLPKEIEDRLDVELNSIIGNGYAVMYVSAQMLVKKSLSDGYLVGSRGSVGSSFAATMAGITEVNPLDPHYLCPKCKHIEWGDKAEYDCGIDMPPKNCPECGNEMKRDGFTIPFATFLGFKGDKEPDIDLNFAGEYQPIAHRYVGEIFGEKNVFKAGTVGTVKDKTAFGYVMKYYEERNIKVNKYEVDRLATACTGVKRTTGQHPGGIIIVPDDHEIFEFCPIQHPADDTESDIVTTHFDYHKIDQNLLKLDLLGHDVPSMIRQLQDMTGIDPLKIDLTDRTVLSIFNGIEALNIKNPNYKFTHGTYAIPEFGTAFTRQMLDDTKPKKFADLVRISGFSHGTDVWLNNAQDYIRKGIATMSDVISTRDDIMNYLMLKGVENSTAFKIMEIVRKGKKDLDEEQVKTMKEHGVPDWYIDSCNKIKYMFPRAHAVAYTMMSFRMAWFKVYYPQEFYATYFTSKVTNFEDEVILKGLSSIEERLEFLTNPNASISNKEVEDITILEVCYEMYSRGFEFLPAKLGESHATKFTVRDGKVQLPFVAIEGVGENAAVALYEAYKEKPFETIEEAQIRAGLNKTVVETLKSRGIFEGLQETDQLSFF